MVQQDLFTKAATEISPPVPRYSAAPGVQLAQLSTPGRAVRAALSTQPQQCPFSHTVGVLVQNAPSADAPRVDAKLGIVLLTCKKNIDIFCTANEIPFTSQKKKKTKK